jgi:hypothetical protein
MDNAQIVAALSVLTWESKLSRDRELILLAKLDIQKLAHVRKVGVGKSGRRLMALR